MGDGHVSDAQEAMQGQDVPEVSSESIVDSTGQVFDNSVHATGSDGNPTFTKNGKFRKKRQTSASKTQSQERSERRALGTVAATSMVQVCVLTFGEDWSVTKQEHIHLSDIWGSYLEEKGYVDLPAGVALAIGISAYAIPRLTQSKDTRGKLKRARDWVVEKVKKRKKGNPALSDNRDDRERKDNAGQENVRGIHQGGNRDNRI